MSRVEIVRLFGRADNYDLSFSRVGGDAWQAELPADMSDGQYACLLTAVDEHGGEAMWAGILYMHEGVATITFEAAGVELSFSAAAGPRMRFDPGGRRISFEEE